MSGEGGIQPEPTRQRLPDTRPSTTHKVKIHDKAMGTVTVYITAGMYADGKPGEVFVGIGKSGTTLNAMISSFAIMVSLALQYGVPLDAIIRRFAATRFEPMGETSNPEIPLCVSIVDYLVRWLAQTFGHTDVLQELEVRGTPNGE